MSLRPGDAAPDFFVQSTDGEGIWLKALRGRTVVVFFFQARGSVASARKAARFRERHDELRAQGACVLGVAVDAPAAVAGFAASHHLEFSLIADPHGELARGFAVLDATTRGAHASTFVIDEVGEVVGAFEPTLAAALHADAVLALLRERGPTAAPRESSGALRTTPHRGAVIDARFRLLELVGKGGMGEVWRAEHLHLNREVAIKLLTNPAGGVDHAAEESSLRRFRFEAQASATIGTATPHVVHVFDAGNSSAGPFLAMELVRGRALADELAEHGPMTPEALLVVLEQLAAALGAAHAAGVVHRDVKPSNVLVSRDAARGVFVKLADFGVAKAMFDTPGFDRPKETGSHSIGTPDYMSPEQLRGAPPDPQMDVWALGVVAYEALTGALPFGGETIAETMLSICGDEPRPLAAARPGVPLELDAWMTSALAKDPARRFRSVAVAVGAFRAALEAATERRARRTGCAPAVAATETPTRFPGNEPRRPIARTAARLGVVLVCLLGTALALDATGEPSTRPDVREAVAAPPPPAREEPIGVEPTSSVAPNSMAPATIGVTLPPRAAANRSRARRPVSDAGRDPSSVF